MPERQEQIELSLILSVAGPLVPGRLVRHTGSPLLSRARSRCFESAPALVAPNNQPAWDMSPLKGSSDAMHNLDHGASAHADFMNGWTQAQIQQLPVDCYYSSPPTSRDLTPGISLST